MSLSPEYFEATRQNYPAIVAAAKQALAAGIVIQPHRGRNAFLTDWHNLPNKPRLDPESALKSANGECFNLGAVISPNPQGDAPGLVVDVDLHGVKDEKDRDDCMAAKKRLLGDLAPTTVTGSGGEHYHLSASAAFIAEIFAPGNVLVVEWEGKAEGKRWTRRRVRCPLDFVSVSALVSGSSVIGATCSLHPKQNDSWAVAAILWGMLIGPPGDMKTPAMNAAVKPLMVLIEEARLKYKEEMVAYSAQKKKYDALMGGLEDELKKAAKSNGDRNVATARVVEQIADLETRAPKEPIHRRYETQDVTVEKVVDLLCDNHRGLMQRLDELTRLLFGFERPDHAGDRSTYLEGYEALHSKSIDRIKRGERYAPNNCITLLGGMQPDAFSAWADVTTDISRNDGFLPRFGMMVYPDVTPWAWTDKHPNRSAYERVVLIWKKLANFDPIAWGAVQGEHDKFPWFQFSPEAQAVFTQWLTELRSERIPAEDDPLIKQHLSKYDRVFCSLSLVFHLIERADYEVRSGGGIDQEGNVHYGFSSIGNQVSAECARRAAAWMEYLESHMRRCYALFGHYRIRNVNVLAAKITSGDLKDGFTKRDIIRRQWTGLKSEDEVRSALDWLEAEGWIRRVQRVSGRGGRPTDRYEIHPEIIAGQKENNRA